MTFDEWLKSVTPAGHVHIAPEDLCAAWDASRREALEEAAKVAKTATGPAYTTDPIALDYLQTKIVEGIRALAAESKRGMP